MKPGNIALTIFISVLLAGMLWVNVQLKAAYNEIDLTDKLRNYLSVDVPDYSILKISGSNGYPIHIEQGGKPGFSILRSRLPHITHQVSGDTLIVQFSAARVSSSTLSDTDTPAGIIISPSLLSGLILTDTHNRITGIDQKHLFVQLKGASYTEFTDNTLTTLSVHASEQSNFRFRNKNVADSTILRLRGNSVGFLEGLNYHVIQPELEDSALFVLSKVALQELMQIQ